MSEAERRRVAADVMRALDAADAAAAAAGLEQLRQTGERDLQVLRLEFRLRRQEGASAAMEALGKEAVARFAEKVEAHRMLVDAHMAAGHWQWALHAGRAALGRFAEDRTLLERGVTIARKLGRTDLAIGWMKRLIQGGHEPARWLAEVGKLLTQSFDGHQGLRHLQAAVRQGAPRQDLLLYLALAAERAGDPPLAARYWSELAETDPSPGNRERARAAIRRIDAQSVTGAQPEIRVEGLQGLVGLSADAEGRAARAVTTAGDVTAWRTAGSRDLVLFFGGIAVMMGAVRASVLPEVRVRGMNGLSFSDPRRLLMLGGSPSLGEDYASSLESLRRLQAAWGADRLYVVGLSAGGYPALRFGTDLKAAGVLLLSPGTTPPEGDHSPLVGRLRASLGEMAVDIRDHVGRFGRDVPVIAAYGSDNADDAWQAERLRGLPNVDLRPIAGFSAHSLAGHEGLPALYEALFAPAP